jgi:hypothetical protein
MSGWHYSMILVKKKGESEYDEDEGLLVEIYLDDNGAPMGFVEANLITIEDLKLAYEDVAKQNGILNTWFYERGTFSWDENRNLTYTSNT